MAVTPDRMAPVDDITLIIEISLKRIRRRFVENYKADFSWDDKLVDTVAARCTEVESGGRNVENVLSRGMLPELSAKILAAVSAMSLPAIGANRLSALNGMA